jgi:WD40 repeat protein
LFYWKEAQSRELAAAAVTNLGDDPERSILLALQAIKTSNTVEAENALHRSILESRVRLVLHHDAEVWSVTFSPDGKRIGTASQDQTAKIWDANTGNLLLTLKGHTASVSGIVFSPDGKRIATSSDDHTARVWDAATGEELFTLFGHTDQVNHIAFSPDGTRLATASNDGTAKIWDAGTGKELLLFKAHGDIVYDIAFSPDGKRVATVGKDMNVRIWDPVTGKESLVLPVDQGGNPEAFRSVAFSPDGKHIAAAGLVSPSIRVWDAITGDLLPSAEPDNNGLYDIAFSANGKLAASGGMDQKAFVWDTATGQVLDTLSGHTNPIHSIAFNPAGSRLATASWDHTVRVWDLTTEKESLFIPLNYGPMFINYSPDGSHLITSYTEQKGTGLYQRKIWDAETGKELVTLHENQVPSASTFGINSYSPDGRLVAGNSGQEVILWDAKTGQELSILQGHTGTVTGLDFSPDGFHLASSSDQGELLIWDLASAKLSLATHRSIFWTPQECYTLFGVNYSPDGKQIVASDLQGDGIICDASTGEKLFTLANEDLISGNNYNPGLIYSASYSPDGTRVVFGYSLGPVRIWSTLTGKQMLTLKGHSGPVLSVKFSPDGKLIATSSLDGSTRLWDATTGENLLMLPIAGYLSFRPDGKRLAIGSQTGVYVFVVSIDDLVDLAKSRVTRSLTQEECQQYLHVSSCPDQ